MNKSIKENIWNIINKNKSGMRKAYNSWKNQSNFLYVGILKNDDITNPFSTLAIAFSKQDLDEKMFTNFHSLRNYFGEDVRLLELNNEIEDLLGDKFHKINVNEIPDWDYKRGCYEDLLNADVLEIAGFNDIKKAVSYYSRVSEYELPYEAELNDLKLEIIYKEIDDSQKYGYITGRILFKNEVIGHFNRSGKWLDEYDYFTHSVDKWKEMMEYIISNINIDKEPLEGINIFKKDDDIYDHAYIKGYHDTDEY